MALPAEFNTISASQINVELGRLSTAAFSMNGVDERALAEKTTSGSLISFNDFHGKSAAPDTAASLSNRTVGHTVLDPADAACQFRLDSDGNAYGGATTSTFLEAWRDAGVSADYECRATKVSGTTPVGFFTNWLALSSDRTWTLNRSTIGSNQCVIDFDIRDAVTLDILTTGRVTMNASVLSPL